LGCCWRAFGGGHCYIVAIVYPEMPEFVFVMVISLGFLAEFFFGGTAMMMILQFLGAV